MLVRVGDKREVRSQLKSQEAMYAPGTRVVETVTSFAYLGTYRWPQAVSKPSFAIRSTMAGATTVFWLLHQARIRMEMPGTALKRLKHFAGKRSYANVRLNIPCKLRLNLDLNA